MQKLNYNRENNQLLRPALARYESQVSSQKKSGEQERYRIAQICKSFLADMVVREISSVEIATYRDLRLEDLNRKTSAKLSPATVRLELSLLSNFFDIAQIEWGLCDENPVKRVRKPKQPAGRERRLTAREDRQILRYCHEYSNPELYVIVVLALETAMRQGEIINLRWEHINLKTRIAHLPDTKNGSKRDVPLSVKARDVLIRLGVKSTGRVFRYSSQGIKTTWRTTMQRLGIENLHFHDLRHEACSRLFEIGTLDVMEIAAISGHKSLAMLKRYTHLKAAKLVRKLEGNKHKGKQVIFDNLVPYPALLTPENGVFSVRLLDFEGVEVQSTDFNEVMKLAQDALLRTLLRLMKETSGKLPSPDQFLESVDEAMIIMVDPLGGADYY